MAKAAKVRARKTARPKARKHAAPAETGGGVRTLINRQESTLLELRRVKAGFDKIARLVEDVHTEHNANTNAIGELTGRVADLDRRMKQLERDFTPPAGQP